MAEFTMTVNLDNAAFEDDPSELVRIIKKVARMVEDGQEGNFLNDINGNKVGSFLIEKDEDEDEVFLPPS